MLGPYIKSRGTRGTKMSANADLNSGDICTTRGNNLKTIFSFMGQNVYFGGILGAPEGVFNDQTKPILLSSYFTLTHIMYM